MTLETSSILFWILFTVAVLLLIGWALNSIAIAIRSRELHEDVKDYLFNRMFW